MGRKVFKSDKKGQHKAPKSHNKSQASSSSSKNIVTEEQVVAVETVQQMPSSTLTKSRNADLSKEELLAKVAEILKAFTKNKKGAAKNDSSLELELASNIVANIDAFLSGEAEYISVCGLVDGAFTALHIPFKEFLANPITLGKSMLSQMQKNGLLNTKVLIMATNQARVQAFSNKPLLEGKETLLQITNTVAAKVPFGSTPMPKQIGTGEYAKPAKPPKPTKTTKPAKPPKPTKTTKPAIPPKSAKPTVAPPNEPITRAALFEAQQQYGIFIMNVSILGTDIRRKSEKNNKGFKAKGYKSLLEAQIKFENSLKSAGNKFFDNDNEHDFEKFKSKVNEAFKEVAHEFQKHRGIWYKLPELARQFLGFVATITLIPGFVVFVTKGYKGYKDTFFTTPKTKSTEGLEAVEKLWSEDVSSSLKTNPGQ